MPLHRFTLLSLVLLLTAGCAGSSLGNSMQRSLKADPRLAEGDPLTGQAASTPSVDSPLNSGMSTPGTTTPASTPSTAAGDQGFAISQPSVSTTSPQPLPSGVDLSTVPQDLKPYVTDVLALGVLPLKTTSTGSPILQLNQPVRRGEYARWLLAANNRFYADQPNQKVRPAVPGNSTPAFKDVPPTSPDFPAVQGLAEAGLIPSTLTGNSTAVNFRPDSPLTREDLLIWKVPLDTRSALPKATVDAVKQVWGFQDAASISPLALQAVLADHQEGEFANIVRAFGYTTLLQPKKAVTQAEAIATLWRFGSITDGISAAELLHQSSGTSASDAPAVPSGTTQN